MILAGWKRIFISDYPKDNQALVEKLASSVNIGVDQVYSALSNRLTFTSNFASTQSTFTVTVDATGKPTNNTVIQLATLNGNNSPVQVSGVFVISATDQTNSTTYPTGAPFISFTQNGNTLSINNITGLAPKDTWSITAIALNSGT